MWRPLSRNFYGRLRGSSRSIGLAKHLPISPPSLAASSQRPVLGGLFSSKTAPRLAKLAIENDDVGSEDWYYELKDLKHKYIEGEEMDALFAIRKKILKMRLSGKASGLLQLPSDAAKDLGFLKPGAFSHFCTKGSFLGRYSNFFEEKGKVSKMGKMVALRSLYRAASRRSSIGFAAVAGNQLLHHQSAPRSLFTLSSATASADRIASGSRSPLAINIGSKRTYSEDVAHLPEIKDPDVLCVFKDLMAASWDELDATVIHDVKNALSKNTDDKSGQEILKNIFRSSKAVEEFSGMVMSLKMELDDSIGMSGEDVKPLTDDYAKAIRMFFERYSAYLESFGPDEAYLRKKVEMELGSKMIFLKMRCAGLGSEWGKVTLIGTSGLAGSYVEQRA